MEPDDPRSLELEYYKRQLDELTGENLRLDYAAAGLRHEVLQKRAGFAILSELQQKIGAHTQISSIFELVVPAVNAALGMERTVVLSPTAREHVFRPAHWLGYRAEEVARLADVSLELTPELADGSATLIVNRATAATPLIDALKSALQLPYFVLVPVAGEHSPIGWLASGRLRENRPLYPPLDQGDLEAFQAIAGLISASARTMRVAWLEESGRLKSEFFANISHEFRTPITLTLGPIEHVLSGRLGTINADVRDRLLMVQRNQERLLNLVNQVLDLAKVEAGGAKLEATRTRDINGVIERRLAPFLAIAEQRGLVFGLDLDPAVPELYVDREMFDKLLTNLVSNAVKFTREGSIVVSTRIRDGSFWLEVSDTGVGVKADQLPHIFDRFRQADGSESREFAGTGIGLALAKEVATLHGGEITVLSEFGQGSTFRVRIPLGRYHLDAASVLEGNESPIPDPAPASVIHEGLADQVGVAALNREAETHFEAGRATVLYAEDNADLRLHVRDVLKVDWNVFVAADGQEALRLARAYRPDVLVTDQMMPRMSGRDLLRAMRADEALRDTPVLFLTARAGTAARIESLESGADDYVTKPFQEAELRARVGNLVRARQQAKQIADLNQRLAARVELQVAELVRAGELLRFLPRPTTDVSSIATTSEEPPTRRKITVLCLMASGLPTLMDALEPHELAVSIDELWRSLLAAAIAQGGTPVHAGADALTVLFGATAAMEPVAQAAAAVSAALRMRDDLPDLRSAWRRRGAPDGVQLRIGITTGVCTVGSFGCAPLRSYGALGAPAVAAWALQSSAEPGEILCGLSTYALLEPRIDGTPRGDAFAIHALRLPLKNS